MPVTRLLTTFTLFIAFVCGSVMTGCEDLPGSREQQSTVIGGAGGAVLGAVIAKENRLIGALIGGALGAAGGYLIGAKTDWFEDDDDEDVQSAAQDAAENARRDPATAEEARRANDADINNDGFVTFDEIVAMDRAGFTDEQMIRRLERTDQVFDLNSEQRRALLDAGVSRNVVDELPNINREMRDRVLSTRGDDVIGRDRDLD